MKEERGGEKMEGSEEGKGKREENNLFYETIF